MFSSRERHENILHKDLEKPMFKSPSYHFLGSGTSALLSLSPPLALLTTKLTAGSKVQKDLLLVNRLSTAHVFPAYLRGITRALLNYVNFNQLHLCLWNFPDTLYDCSASNWAPNKCSQDLLIVNIRKMFLIICSYNSLHFSGMTGDFICPRRILFSLLNLWLSWS